ncbi:hypothetical protein BC2230_90152 [Burkholderia cepacia]
MLVAPFDTAIRGLPNPADGLAPAKVLFDALANHLADAITGVSRGAAVDRAGTLRSLIEVANHTGTSNPGLIVAADPVTESRYSHHRFVTGYTGMRKGRNGCRPWSAPVFIFR